MTREEILIAYVDGELSKSERARFETEMAADPTLKAQVARHRAVAAQVNVAYTPVLDEAVPAHLLALAKVANDPGRPAERRLAPRIATAAAIAASLVVGVVAGRLAWPMGGPLAVQDGALVAHGQLAAALSNQLAAQPGLVKVALSLRTPSGQYCRTFQSGADRLAGLACRQGKAWVVRTVTAWTPANNPTGEPNYRTAGSDTPPEVLAAVDSLAAQPLDAAAERVARGRDWK